MDASSRDAQELSEMTTFIHNEFHKLGEKVIKAIKESESKKAKTIYNKALALSKELIIILDDIYNKLNRVEYINDCK